MKTLHDAVATLITAVLTAALCLGQAPAGRKSYTFHGKVVSVNKDTQRITVNGEKVEGWMAAMTMNYQVDDPSLFTRLKPGDQIAATVSTATTSSITSDSLHSPQTAWRPGRQRAANQGLRATSIGCR